MAVALAAPQEDKKPIEIVSSNSEMNADGSYSFAYVDDAIVISLFHYTVNHLL